MKMITKRCKGECQQDLPYDAFHRNAASIDGRASVCKTCTNVKYKAFKAQAKQWTERGYQIAAEARKERKKLWAKEKTGR